MFQFWNGTPVPNNIVFDFVILWSGLPGLSLNFASNDITNKLHIGWRVHNQKTRSVGLTKPYPPPRIRSMPKSKNFFYWWLPLVKWAKVLFCIYHIWLYIFCIFLVPQHVSLPLTIAILRQFRRILVHTVHSTLSCFSLIACVSPIKCTSLHFNAIHCNSMHLNAMQCTGCGGLGRLWSSSPPLSSQQVLCCHTIL